MFAGLFHLLLGGEGSVRNSHYFSTLLCILSMWHYVFSGATRSVHARSGLPAAAAAIQALAGSSCSTALPGLALRLTASARTATAPLLRRKINDSEGLKDSDCQSVAVLLQVQAGIQGCLADLVRNGDSPVQAPL
jgi:hypothetical protein